jgi:hypothetical protein
MQLTRARPDWRRSQLIHVFGLEEGDARMVAKKARVTARMAMIRDALASSEPLASVREVIAESNREQKTVVWAYACLLEANSAGLTILFDRFTPAEIGRIERALVEIGATGTASNLRSLRQAVEKTIAGGASRAKASEALGDSATGKAIDSDHHAQVQEIEAKLLAYCAEHERELAAG